MVQAMLMETKWKIFWLAQVEQHLYKVEQQMQDKFMFFYGQQNTTAAMGIWGSDFNLSTLISSPLLGRDIDGAVSNTQIEICHWAQQEILMQMDFQMFWLVLLS